MDRRIVLSIVLGAVAVFSATNSATADCGSASACNYDCSGVASGMSYHWFQNPCDNGGTIYVDVLNTSGGSASFVAYKDQSCTAQHVVANSGCLSPGGDDLLVFDASKYVAQYFLAIGKCSGSAVYVVEITWDCDVAPIDCEPGYPPGSTKACGDCGTKTCQSNGSWSSCTGQGDCSPGQKDYADCGNCGTKSKTCNNSCSWGGWSSCTGQGDCSPGQTEACAECGTMTCNDSCDWGTCTGDDNGLCNDGLCCTEDICDADGSCSNLAIDCQPGWACQEATCQCVEGCGQFTEFPECQGDVLFWCEEGALQQEDCASNNEVCVSDAPAYCCAPDCAAKECGPDGCGGSCGECPENAVCSNGLCECVPDCAGKECGEDGCGALCGSCSDGYYCHDGQCMEGECIPNCEGKECGNGGCEGQPDACGECSDSQMCQQGQCVSDEPCEPDCFGVECGDDGCGGSCGKCPETKPFCVAGSCKSDCEPACDGKECGDDGCGGDCGMCPAAAPNCVKGKCALDATCVPDCVGNECGDDGCGGSCGNCPEAAPLCIENTCQPADDAVAGEGTGNTGGCSMARPGESGATRRLTLLLLFFLLLVILHWPSGRSREKIGM